MTPKNAENTEKPQSVVASSDLLAAVELLKEMREACAACFRVIAQTEDPTIMERFDAELSKCGVKEGFGVRTQDFIAAKLICALSAETFYKSDCFDYLCWLEETHQSENVKGCKYLVLASDGITCWGHTYADAVKIAMHHDKELYDAWKDLEMPEPEALNTRTQRRRATEQQNNRSGIPPSAGVISYALETHPKSIIHELS